MSLDRWSSGRLVKGVIVGLLLLASGTANSSPNDGANPAPNPDRGQYIFRAYCVGCHGENGRGDGPMASKLFRDFGVRPSDLASEAFQSSNSDAQLAKVVKGGGRASHKTDFMPAWGGTLSPKQVGDLVAFMRELKPREVEVTASMVNVGDQIELGRVLYTIRCLACHGPSGKGNGPFIEGFSLGGANLVALPDFSNYEVFRGRSDKDVESVLKLGVGHSGLVGQGENGWWDQALDPEETRSLILYLRTLPLQVPKGQG